MRHTRTLIFKTHHDAEVSDLRRQVAKLEAENEELKSARQCGAENPHKLVPSKCPTCGETLIPACCLDLAQDFYRYGKEDSDHCVAGLEATIERLKVWKCGVCSFDAACNKTTDEVVDCEHWAERSTP